jgi:RHS repeat-associated protein
LAGTAYWETGSGWNITGKRTFAIWAKATADGAWVCICVKSTDNSYYGLVYQGTTGADYNTGNGGVIRVGGTAQDFTNGEWVRLERDLQADLTARFGKTLSCVTGIYLWSGGLTTPKMWIDDLSFSNSLTIEHNTLGVGSIGHILRNRSTSASTCAATDRWFHYDQVGSVMAESDASGALVQTHYQDAFGNSQASWSTGLWGGDKPGWHHNSKEYDGDVGLVYMYHRWYGAEFGGFGSEAPLPRTMEAPYLFTSQAPTGSTDPTGRLQKAARRLGEIAYHKCCKMIDRACGRDPDKDPNSLGQNSILKDENGNPISSTDGLSEAACDLWYDLLKTPEIVGVAGAMYPAPCGGPVNMPCEYWCERPEGTPDWGSLRRYDECVIDCNQRYPGGFPIEF